jgi:ATP-dependent Clp protease ATP-binding subunit ClpC
MFERYTESARRALFFARYEVSQLGATAIEPEHLLLGVVRETGGVVAEILSSAGCSPDTLRQEVERRSGTREKIATSVEVPFADGAKRVLKFAEEEANRLRHRNIAPEHLLSALLREEGSVAASVLTSRGLTLDSVRGAVAKLSADSERPPTFMTGVGVFDEIEQIKQSVGLLAGMAPDNPDAQPLVERIRIRLDGLKRLLRR